jgi:hypothetical protein
MPPDTSQERLDQIAELARTGKVDTSSLDSARAGGLTIKEWRDYQADRARNMQIANSRVGVEPPTQTRVMGVPPVPRVTGSSGAAGSAPSNNLTVLGPAEPSRAELDRYATYQAAYQDYVQKIENENKEREDEIARQMAGIADQQAFMARNAASLAALRELIPATAQRASGRIAALRGQGSGSEAAERMALAAAQAEAMSFADRIQGASIGSQGVGTGPVSGDAAAIANQLSALSRLDQTDVRDQANIRDAMLDELAASVSRMGTNYVADREVEAERSRLANQRALEELQSSLQTYEAESGGPQEPLSYVDYLAEQKAIEEGAAAAERAEAAAESEAIATIPKGATDTYITSSVSQLAGNPLYEESMRSALMRAGIPVPGHPSEIARQFIALKNNIDPKSITLPEESKA